MSIYQIEFYGNKRNNEIESFMSNLQPSTISKSIRIMNLLKKRGLIIGMPFIKKIDNDLYELRIKGREEVRYLFGTFGTIFYIVHAFKKKTNKITKNDLTIAKKRLYNI